jgi:alpha-L-rhamnosidase
MRLNNKLQAEWIWLPQQAEKVNQYVEFRHEFTMDETDHTSARLYISVDTEYAVWLNGTFVDCGQYDDYPDKKVYDVLPVGTLLKSGRNILCILAYYQGENSFQYIKGMPRLIYSIDAGNIHISSGRGTLCRESSAYKCGPADKITMQLSFSFEYQAIGYDGWNLENYIMDSGWGASEIIQDLSLQPMDFNERPIKKLNIKERAAACLITQGVIIRRTDQDKTVAQLMQTDFLSHRPENEIFKGYYKKDLPSPDGIHINPQLIKDEQGFYVVIDLGREEAGFLELELDTDEGTVADIGYGEHLDDLRVRTAVGGRNFAVRYICREGLQKFTHYFKRIAGRYIQLHISNMKEKFILYYAGVRPVEYPVEIKGSFCCSDHLFNKIYDVSVRTARLCMHEHYEDTPWREQALYGMDSRIQALCGYYCFGDYDFPISSFELLGNSLKEDGYLEICAPAEFDVTIPSFSLAWIIELGDYLLFSGRVERLKALLPKVKKMLDSYLCNLQDGLMITPVEKKYWNFYEWTDGLDDSDNSEESADNKYRNNTRIDAPLNLFLCMALDSAINIAKCCGDLNTAKEYEIQSACIKNEFHKQFWNKKSKIYKTFIGEGCNEHYAELVQALAILSGACPKEIAPILRERLAEEDNGLVKTSLSYSLYKYQAMMEEPKKYAKTVFDLIAKDWGYMLYNGATSFWETISGANDFDFGGSLSHGWSAIPIYFFYTYVLGVKPLEPGFKTFKAEPIFGVVNSAAGKVPTPYGDIELQWKECNSEIKLQINYPEGIKMEKLEDITPLTY